MEGALARAPEPGRRERKKQQTRQLIAEVARGLFSERGFEHVTVAEVAQAADVAQQTVFNYFPTKEDLVYWQLERFEEELLSTIRDRAPGESALTAFGRFMRQPRGMLANHEPEVAERLAGVTRMITESPSLLARERQIFAGYTDSLAALLAKSDEAGSADVRPWVAANAMMGVHQALVGYARRRVLEGARSPGLAQEVLAEADRALGLLEDGLGDYAVKPR